MEYTYDGLPVDPREFTIHGYVEAAFALPQGYFIIFNTGTIDFPVTKGWLDAGPYGEYLYNISNIIQRDTTPPMGNHLRVDWGQLDVVQWVSLPKLSFRQSINHSTIEFGSDPSPQDGYFLIKCEQKEFPFWLTTSELREKIDAQWIIDKQQTYEERNRRNRQTVDDDLKRGVYSENKCLVPLKHDVLGKWPWLHARARFLTGIGENAAKPAGKRLLETYANGRERFVGGSGSASFKFRQHLATLPPGIRDNLVPSELSPLYASFGLDHTQFVMNNYYFNPLREFQRHGIYDIGDLRNEKGLDMTACDVILIGTDVERLTSKLSDPWKYPHYSEEGKLDGHLKFLLLLVPPGYHRGDTLFYPKSSSDMVVHVPLSKTPSPPYLRSIVQLWDESPAVDATDYPTKIGGFCDLYRLTRKDPLDCTIFTTSYINLSKDPYKVRVARTSYYDSRNPMEFEDDSSDSDVDSTAEELEAKKDIILTLDSFHRNDVPVYLSISTDLTDEPADDNPNELPPAIVPKALFEGWDTDVLSFELAESEYFSSRTSYLMATTHQRTLSINFRNTWEAYKTAAIPLALRLIENNYYGFSPARLYLRKKPHVFSVENNGVRTISDLDHLLLFGIVDERINDELNGSITIIDGNISITCRCFRFTIPDGGTIQFHHDLFDIKDYYDMKDDMRILCRHRMSNCSVM